MPQTDILNPTPKHPLNWDYGFQRKRPVTHLNLKANRGVPFFRDITDVGHQFLLNWSDRPAHVAEELKRYYEQYRDGFFTIVDHESYGRHYVGRFSTPIEPVPTSHNHWAMQQILFDEIPGVPMVTYPNRWDWDAVWQLLISDFNDVMAAASGSWTLTANAAAKSDYEYVGANTVTTDWAAYQYYGYGFQFWARTGSALGIGQLVLDGTVLGNVDFYSAAAAAPSALVTQLNVPLGIHLVQLNATNTKNSASSAKTILWDALRVMR